jgi:hypothetical protein
MILIDNAERYNNQRQALKTSTLSTQVINSILHWIAVSYLRNSVDFPSTDQDRPPTPGKCGIFQLFR